MIKFELITVGYLETNCYLIYDEQSENALVVDPGGDYERIISLANSINKTVKAVLLTHAHFDHALEIEKFKANGAKVYLHKNEQEVALTSANLSAYLNGEFVKFIADNELIGGLVDICGFKIEVIETPGHTKGSVCYAIDNYLFCGDTLFDMGFGRVDFPTGNAKTLYQSIQKLFSLKKDYILLPGHGTTTTLFYQKQHNLALEYLGKHYG